MVIPVGESIEVKIGIGGAKMKLWVTRGPDWVPTVISGLGRTKYLQMTNIGDREIILPTHAILGLWTEGDMVPRTQGFVTVGSGKYKEWQTLAYEATKLRRIVRMRFQRSRSDHWEIVLNTSPLNVS